MRRRFFLSPHREGRHCLAIAGVLSLLFAASPAAAQTLRIYQIDVEQADAALFVMPNGKTLLIDSGNNGAGPRIQAVMARAGHCP